MARLGAIGSPPMRPRAFFRFRSSNSHPCGRTLSYRAASPNHLTEGGLDGLGKMGFRKGFAAAAAAAVIAAGAGFGLRAAQSFTIPPLCAEGVSCSYVCHSVVEQGRTASDFIAL